jgi:hypothetical protein
VATYDAVTPGYDVARPLAGALQHLAGAGFFNADDLGEAIVRGEEELPDEMPEEVQRVAEVIANFRSAAD